MCKITNVGKFVVLKETPKINEEYQTFKVHSIAKFNEVRRGKIRKCVYSIQYNGLEFLKSKDFLLLKEFHLEEKIDELLEKIKGL